MKYPARKLAVALAINACFSAVTVQAASLNDVNNANAKKTMAAQKSQKKIDSLDERKVDLLSEYRQTGKLVDDLKVYNTKLAIQIDKQQQRLHNIEKSIADVQVIQRQITPLIERMIASLEQFIALDMPFHQEERTKRIQFLRANLDRPELSVAEKFRQLLEAYKIENEYGRKIDTYGDKVTIDGVERDVTMFRVGRIALMYQTADLQHTGMWDKKAGQYIALESSQYRDAVRRGTRIANKQANINMLELPIAAPEALK
ncbi:MAG: DUF3450 domain-containing protein [Pseudomonadales bacterium]|nr:DUF3450 domain-containing protein [Pseudomonadales bacterium]